MSFTTPAVMAGTKDNKRECAFMRLPTEIRLMIYRPLLISEYTMMEHHMNSKEVSFPRSSCLMYADTLTF